MGYKPIVGLVLVAWKSVSFRYRLRLAVVPLHMRHQDDDGVFEAIGHETRHRRGEDDLLVIDVVGGCNQIDQLAMVRSKIADKRFGQVTGRRLEHRKGLVFSLAVGVNRFTDKASPEPR